MRYLLFILGSAARDLLRNKMRTILTSLGILIGVASVVLLIALGLGLKGYIAQQFDSMGTNLIMVLPGGMIENGAFTGGGSMTTSFDIRDATALRRNRNAAYVVPMFATYAKIQGTAKTATYETVATTTDAFVVLNVTADTGRLFTRNDEQKGAKVVVLGPTVADKVFGTRTGVVGKTVKIGGQGYRVVGIAVSKGGGGGAGMPSIDDHVYIPYSAATSLNPDKKFMMIYLKADAADSVPQLIADTKKTMLKRYKTDDFSVTEQKELMKAIDSIFTILNTVLVAIAAISLVVGGVGIMNIMYVSVTERIKEIGIRRALGATRRDILSQFLTEAVVLSLTGGLMGLAVAAFVVMILRTVFPAYIDLPTVGIALGVSSAVGIIFGVFPAKKAADLSPIDAIRYE